MLRIFLPPIDFTANFTKLSLKIMCFDQQAKVIFLSYVIIIFVIKIERLHAQFCSKKVLYIYWRNIFWFRF